MTIRVPELHATYIQHCIACVYFDAQEKGICDWTSRNGHIDLDVPLESNDEWIGLLVDPPDSDGQPHLHVNLARAAWFDDDPPIANGSLQRINEIFEACYGASGFLNAMCTFEVPAADIPESGLVKALAGISTDAGGLQLSLAGADLKVSGGQFRRVSWSSGEGVVRGSLVSSRIPIVISEHYLDEAVRLLNDGILRIILGKPSVEAKA